MQTKLTLRLEGSLIEQAKQWAKESNVSLSQIVAQLFAQLPPKNTDISPWMQNLLRLSEGTSHITDLEIKEDYARFLEEKHL